MEITEIHPLVILLAAITTDNILLTRFLGMCPFLAVSKSLKSAFGLGAAVVFVLTFTTILNWLLYHLVLVPYNLAYLQYVAFIIVIAAFVQVVEMAVERLSTPLYMALGIFLPLITVNCAILGGCLFMVSRNYTLLQSAGFGFGSGVGWMLAILAMAGIREKMQKKAQVVPQLEGPGIALIIAGTMALAFMGFSGVLRIS